MGDAPDSTQRPGDDEFREPAQEPGDTQALAYLPSYSRETTLRRDASGRWFHDGERVRHRGVARAFDRWLARAPDGRFCLKNSVNWAYVGVEGPAYFVRSVALVGNELTLTLSDGAIETLVPETLQHSQASRYFCRVKDGLEAAFDRHATFALSDFLVLEGESIWLALGDARYPVAARPLATSRESSSAV